MVGWLLSSDGRWHPLQPDEVPADACVNILSSIVNAQWLIYIMQGIFILGSSFGTNRLFVAIEQNLLLLFPQQDAGSVGFG